MPTPNEETVEVNEETVEVADEGVVTVDVIDKPELAEEGKEGVVVEATSEAKPEPRKKGVPRVRLKQDVEAKASPAEEATAALTQAVKTADDARKAAEATALAERRRADDATRLTQQREQELRTAQEVTEFRELALLTTGIENATRELAAYQDEMQRALEAGEFAKVTATQVKMAKAASALDRFEATKADYEAGNRKPTTEGRVEAPQQQVSAFERYVGSFAPQAQAWLRQHPECVPANVGGNAVSNAKMMKGHYAALEQGLEPNTPDYFRVIEETAGYRMPVSAAAKTTEAGDETDDEVEAEVAKPKPKFKAQPSAPVSRDPLSANGASRTTRSVTLSKEQQDAAKISFPQLGPKEAFAQYARNLLELEAEGKMGRFTH